MLAQVLDPWRYQWHPAVWVLVAFLTGAYIYMVRVIGPKAVAPGQHVVTRFNIGCFIGAMRMLWVAAPIAASSTSGELPAITGES